MQSILTHDISDEAFRRATEALGDSTTDLLAQCQVLERQSAQLKKSAQDDSRTRAAGPNQEDLQRSIAKQRSQLGADIEQLRSSLAESFSTTSSQIDSVLKSFPDNASRNFEKDDRVLDGLQRITSRLEASDQLEESLEQVDILCKNYAIFECQAVFIRIDDVYKKALQSASRKTDLVHRRPDKHAELQGLKVELEELYDEVNGLVQLLAEHRYRVFIQQSLEQSHVVEADEASRWSEYTAGVLLYLTARLEALEELIKHARIHRSAMTTLQASLQSAIKEQPRPEQRRNQTSSPIISKAGLRPLRLVQSSLSQTQDQIAPLLRTLDIEQLDSSSNRVHAQLTALLESRSSSSRALQRSSHAQVGADINTSLQHGQQHVDDLLQTLSTMLQDDQVNVLDKDTTSQLNAFEKRTAITAQGMQSLDVEQLSEELQDATADTH